MTDKVVLIMGFSGANGNNDLIKKLNLENVLRTLIAHQPLSRAQIASRTGLNKVTVSSCVDYFVANGIVEELGKSETSRGRPPTLLEVNRQAGICVGIEVEYKELKILVTDAMGTTLEKRTLELADKHPRYFVEFLSSLIAELKSAHADYPFGIIGVGIALAGYYNHQTGIVEYIANLQSWNQFPILSEIRKIDSHIRFYINSTVNAGAIGEMQSLGTKTPEVFVYVGGLWGLGVGVCLNGKVFSGTSGFAGRLGHSTIKIDGKPCTCGNKGCWELYGSADALYQRLYPQAPSAFKDFSRIVERLKEDDPEVLAAVKELGHYHGIGLANVINAYNPDVICIGGYLGLLGSPLVEAIHTTLHTVLPEHFLANLTIYCSEFGEFSSAFGAISMVVDHLSEVFVQGDRE